MSDWDPNYFQNNDEETLADLGYKQQLLRNLGLLHNFGISFSTVSVLTGITILFSYGLAIGGPATMIIGWIIVSFFTCFIALGMAEIASACPTSGGPYYWSAILAPPNHSAFASWVTAWFNLLGQLAATSALSFGLAELISTLLTVRTSYYPENSKTICICGGIVVSWGLMNTLGRRGLRWLLYFAITLNSFGAIALATAVLSNAPKHQSAGFVFKTFIDETGGGVAPGWSARASYAYVACCGCLMSQYTLLGYDASAHVAEETRRAAQFAPIGLISAVVSSTVIGFLLLMAFLFSIQDLDTTLASPYNQPILQILMDIFGETRAILLFSYIIICVWHCGLYAMTSTSRLVFAFSRDNGLPHYFSKVSDTFLCPARAVWFVAVGCFILALPALRSLVAFTAVTSIATIGALNSYAIPILIGLIYHKRFLEIKGPFNLGCASRPVALVAVLYIWFITVILCLPTTNPVTTSTFNYASIAICTVFLGSVATWVIARRHFDGPVFEKASLHDGSNLLTRRMSSK